MSIRRSENIPIGLSRVLLGSMALVLVLFLTTFASSAEAAAHAGGGLTAKQARIVLRVLDNVCGDTWCEGDYDWRFKKIICSMESASCTITVTLRERGSHLQAIWRTCKFQGYTGFDSLVIEYPQGGPPAIEDAFYEQMTLCAERIEQKLPSSAAVRLGSRG